MKPDLIASEPLAYSGEIVPAAYAEIEAQLAYRTDAGDAIDRPLPFDIYSAFADFIQLSVADGDATEDTVRSYYQEAKMYVAWCQARGIEPEQATRRTIENYRAWMKEQGLQVTTRSLKLSIVRRFYEAAVSHGLRADNPARNVRGGKDLTPPEEKIKALTDRALRRLSETIKEDRASPQYLRNRAIVALMAVHGLRRVEIGRLDHSDLEGALGDANPFLNVTGKGMKRRRVYLRQDTYALLLDYIQWKCDHALPLAGALFLSHSNATRGQRISRRALNWIVDNYLNAAALKRAGVSCHALRHTHGTLAVAGGAKIEHLREEMGHQSVQSTGIYVKAVSRIKENPANFIDVRFDE